MAHQKLILEEDNVCAGCGINVDVPDGLVFDAGDLCYECMYKDYCEVKRLVAAVFDAPGGSESIDSEEYTNALEALGEWNSRNET